MPLIRRRKAAPTYMALLQVVYYKVSPQLGPRTRAH